MQETLTHEVYQKKFKLDFFKIFLCVFFALFFLIFLLFIFLSRPKNYFKEVDFYFVCAASSSKQNEVEVYLTNLKSAGGGGVIFKYRDIFYLIANVYLEESDAEEVKANLLGAYSGACVLKVTAAKVSGSKKQEIKLNDNAMRFFKFKSESISQLSELQMSYLTGQITESELELTIVKKRLELEDMIFSQKPDGEVLQTVYTYQSLFLHYFEVFELGFFQSTKKASVLAEFLINLTILNYQLCNNL